MTQARMTQHPKAAFSPRKTPNQARARTTVEKILSGAVQLLTEQGAEAFTTRAIADISGVRSGSIYQYFPHKEAILYEIYRRRMEVTVNAFRELLAGGSLELGVDQFMDRLSHMLRVDLEWGQPADIALDKAIGENPELRLAVADVLDELYDCLITLLKYYGCQWSNERMRHLAEYLFNLNHFGYTLRIRQDEEQSQLTRLITDDLQTYLIKRAISEDSSSFELPVRK